MHAWPGSLYGQEAWPKLPSRPPLLPRRPVPGTVCSRQLEVRAQVPSPQGPHQRTHVRGHLSPAAGPGGAGREGRQGRRPRCPATPIRRRAAAPEAGQGGGCRARGCAGREEGPDHTSRDRDSGPQGVAGPRSPEPEKQLSWGRGLPALGGWRLLRHVYMLVLHTCVHTCACKETSGLQSWGLGGVIRTSSHGVAAAHAWQLCSGFLYGTQ